MDLQVTYESMDDLVEIDNGIDYIKMSLDEAKELHKKLSDVLYTAQKERNLEKDWNYLGGL